MQIPSLERFEAAAKLLAGRIVETPLVALRQAPAGSSILLKPEILQPVGSFKLRGVLHAVARLDASQRARGLETVSAGNTAQALAWAGRHFGVPALCIMPEGAPQTKIDAVRALGGEVQLLPRPELFRYMREHLWERSGRSFIHPWTEPEVWVGHGSIALEIHRELPRVGSVFIPLGGGGLLTGVAGALRALQPGVRIVAVEPEGCAAFHAAREAGHPVQIECATQCDGVAVPFITEELFPLLNELVDEVQLVPEAAIASTTRRLAFGNHMIVEGAGALALAAALASPTSQPGPSVCLLTGGSVDPDRLRSILASGPDG